MDKRKKELIKQYKKEINIINEMVAITEDKKRYEQLRIELLQSVNKAITITYDQM